MTLVELQNKLGVQIELLTDPNVSFTKKREIAETASVISSVAKQMINNADVMLRREKLIAEGKMTDERMKELVG